MLYVPSGDIIYTNAVLKVDTPSSAVAKKMSDFSAEVEQRLHLRFGGCET